MHAAFAICRGSGATRHLQLAQAGGITAAGLALGGRDAAEEPPDDGEAEAIAAVSARQAMASRDLLSLDLRLPQAGSRQWQLTEPHRRRAYAASSG